MPDQWHHEDGWSLNAVYGYARFLLEFLDATRPAHCAAAFDESLGTCFRNEILASYKSSRELPDEAFTEKFEVAPEQFADYLALVARKLTGLEEHIPSLSTPPDFELTRESLANAEAYLAELNLSGPLTRRCQSLQKSLPV